MKQGDLIAVSGTIYEYGGIEHINGAKFHKVYAVEIDEEGILTATYDAWYLTDEGLADRGIDLTEKQWIGLTEHFIRQDYDLTDEEISEAAEDIVYRCFVTTRIPLVDELPNYIAEYMDR